jgi:hypothetical protein
MLNILRAADWLDAERARAYVRILLVVQAAGLAVLALTSSNGMDSRGEPLGTDFVSFWTAGRMALAGAPASVYDSAAHHAAEQALFGASLGWYAFFYPPVYLLLCMPLAVAPYFVALAGWIVATCAAYVLTLRQLVAKAVGVAPLLAFPAVLTTIGHGQNAFLSTALFGAGTGFLAARPALAGVFFGCLTYKPQLAVIVPLGLAVTGRWRAFASMGATALALALLSYGAFGEATWRGFLAESTLARETLEQGLVEPEKMQSLFAAVRLLGGGVALAYGAQIALAGGILLALAVLLRRTPDAALQGALMVVAALLTTPFVLDYDLTLLALPLAVVFARAAPAQFLPYEKSVLLAAFVLPAVSRPLAQHAHLPLAPVVLLLLFVALARRVRAEAP